MLQEQVLINYFTEICIKKAFDQKLLGGTLHLSLGQESIDVGVISAYDNPLVFGNHRSHGQYLICTKDIDSLIIQLKNGRSQHLYCKDKFISHGIQGGLCPIAVGNALAFKKQGINRRVICFVGDGTLAQGTFTESLYLAAIYKAPITFVVIDNGYSMSATQCPNAPYFAYRLFHSYNIPSDCFHDIKKVDIVQSKVRTNIIGPYGICFRSNRLCGHSCSDTEVYRPEEEKNKIYFAKYSPGYYYVSSMKHEDVENIKNYVINKFAEHLDGFVYDNEK